MAGYGKYFVGGYSFDGIIHSLPLSARVPVCNNGSEQPTTSKNREPLPVFCQNKRTTVIYKNTGVCAAN
jgi:hypothetical protein